jgi:hypothetical protein
MLINREYTLEVKVYEESYPTILLNGKEVYGNKEYGHTTIVESLTDLIEDDSNLNHDLLIRVDINELLLAPESHQGTIFLKNGNVIGAYTENRGKREDIIILPKIDARPLYLWLCDTQHIEKSVQEILSILRERINFLLDEIEKRCIEKVYKEEEAE